jgi:hypothetical protein
MCEHCGTGGECGACGRGVPYGWGSLAEGSGGWDNRPTAPAGFADGFELDMPEGVPPFAEWDAARLGAGVGYPGDGVVRVGREVLGVISREQLEG